MKPNQKKSGGEVASSATRVISVFGNRAIDIVLPDPPIGIGEIQLADWLRRSRIVVASTIALFSASVVFLILTLIVDKRWTGEATGLLVAACASAIILIAFRISRSINSASWMLTLSTVGVVSSISISGGDTINGASVWLFVVPTLATFYLGGRATLVLSICAIAAMTVIFTNHTSYERIYLDPIFFWLSSSAAIGFLGFVSLTSERERQAIQERLAETLAEMRELNTRLSARNEEFEAARDVAVRDASVKERFIDRMKHEEIRQQAALEATSESMRSVDTVADTLSESADGLAMSAVASSATVEEMTRTNDSVVESVKDLVNTANLAMAEIDSMTKAIKEIDGAIAGLSISAEEASMSMSQMQASSAHIQENANTTAELAEAVIRDAERGVATVSRTVHGIEEISATSTNVFEIIRSLDRQTNAISDVLLVIDDVTHQTNLLALNAAILAAQAGEDGQGFAVVADEIKKLAERTRTSTSAIAELIHGVQAESKNAVGAIRNGEAAIESGVRLSEESQGAFATIVQSAQRSTEMARAIAGASAEQLLGARIVSQAAEQVAITVADVAEMSQRQAEGGEKIVRAATRMRSVAEHVERATEEGAVVGREILGAMMGLSEMSTRLNHAQQSQAESTRQVLEAMDQIRSVQERQNRSVLTLAGDIEDDEITGTGLNHTRAPEV